MSEGQEQKCGSDDNHHVSDTPAKHSGTCDLVTSVDAGILPKACTLFVRLSLSANIVVLVAVCTVLTAFGSSEPVVYAWGPPTAGRGILLSIYFSIMVVSTALLVLHTHSNASSRTAVDHMVAALLTTQILYKITTPATAGAANPVAISNLCISALHTVTLYFLWHTIIPKRSTDVTHENFEKKGVDRRILAGKKAR
jgi:hypothetical protein